MQTPNKQPESASTTHEEEEEMLHDISKLQDQVQQMSLSQKLTEAKINGVESKRKGVEAKMNGMEAKMDDLKIDLKADMVDLKTDLTNFLQEILTNGERVVKETHDAKKRNVNHDFIDSNVGSKRQEANEKEGEGNNMQMVEQNQMEIDPKNKISMWRNK